jgi:hypothetical protein
MTHGWFIILAILYSKTTRVRLKPAELDARAGLQTAPEVGVLIFVSGRAAATPHAAPLHGALFGLFLLRHVRTGLACAAQALELGGGGGLIDRRPPCRELGRTENLMVYLGCGTMRM